MAARLALERGLHREGDPVEGLGKIVHAVHQQLRRVPCPSLIGNVSVLMEFAVPLLVDAGFGPTMVQEKVRGL